MATAPNWGDSKGFRQLARMAGMPGAGQVVVEGNYAYIGHMRPPVGTTILDISDLKNPRIVAQIRIPDNVHSHKVRVAGDVMICNRERFGPYKGDEMPRGGLMVYDISDRTKPKEIAFVEAGHWGYHRFTFDGRYCYGTPEPEGFIGNIVGILDLNRPEKPEYVSQWWVPGQWEAGGEDPLPEGRRVRAHHPLRMGDRLYCGYWMHGWYILDISDIAHPKPIAHRCWTPPFPHPCHTTLPIPHEIMGRKWLMVADEEARDRRADIPNAFLWMVDITDETNPAPVSNYRAREIDEPFDDACWYGCHQPQEQIFGNRFAVTWFAGGLRMVDVSNPYRPEELGYYVPEPGEGQAVTQSNDVFCLDDHIYLTVDRLGGFDIVEWVGA
jgi:hypothetical protein